MVLFKSYTMWSHDQKEELMNSRILDKVFFFMTDLFKYFNNKSFKGFA